MLQGKLTEVLLCIHMILIQLGQVSNYFLGKLERGRMQALQTEGSSFNPLLLWLKGF